MPQSGSGSTLANIQARRQKLSAVRQKMGLESVQQAGIQSNLRPAGVPSRTPTRPGTAPQRPKPAAPAARPAAPAQAPVPAPAPAQAQPGAAPVDKREQMLVRAQEFIGMTQYARRSQRQAETAVPGHSRQMLSGGF